MPWETHTTLLSKLETFEAPTAWRVIDEGFRVPVQRLARRAGLGPEGADEVAQETLIAFATAYRDGRFVRGQGRLSSWLFGIARRQILAARRRDASGPAALWTEAENDLVAEDDFESAWEAEWRRAVLERCLARVCAELEPETVDAFWRLVFDRASVAEVMEATGLSRTAVYNAKHRVAKRLRELAAELDDG